ncbi:MAG: hypothetical protein ACN6QH_25570 [Pseudomonas sp.]|uniref:hypothetical protein n=1 Tax=Pseudomonas sp. TaxID=306 RepID=UPI003D118A47
MTDSTPQSSSSLASTPGTLDLSVPSVPLALEPITGGEENLLPISALTAPLRVEFDRWSSSNPGPGRPEILELLWNAGVVERKSWTAPIADNDLFILLPTQYLVEGVHQLRYRVTNALGNAEESDPLTVTIDTTPPAAAQTPVKMTFPFAVVSGGITNSYLANNNDQVIGTVPQYGFKPGDRVKVFWEKVPASDKPFVEAELTDKRAVIFEGDQIRELENAQWLVSYLLEDRAGNVSRLSAFEQIQVNIAPPVPRVLPSIDKAKPGNPGEGVLYAGEATNGVIAIVPEQPDDISEATLTVYWRGFGELGSFQTSQPIPGKDLRFEIPSSAIPSNMGRQVEVYYTLQWPGGGEPEVSATYTVRVVAMETRNMMLLTCQQSVNSTVSLARVPASGANLAMGPWPYKPSADGLRINIWVTGQDKQDKLIRFDLLQGVAVAKNSSPVPAVLPKPNLEKLQLNKIFAVRAAVSFDDGETYLEFKALDLNLTT